MRRSQKRDLIVKSSITKSHQPDSKTVEPIPANVEATGNDAKKLTVATSESVPLANSEAVFTWVGAVQSDFALMSEPSVSVPFQTLMTPVWKKMRMLESPPTFLLRSTLARQLRELRPMWTLPCRSGRAGEARHIWSTWMIYLHGNRTWYEIPTEWENNLTFSWSIETITVKWGDRPEIKLSGE